METLWGDEERTAQTAKKKPLQQEKKKGHFIDNSCRYYGHAWQVIGMLGEKQCTVCSVKIYCPRCTTHPLNNAVPVYCPLHMPGE